MDDQSGMSAPELTNGHAGRTQAYGQSGGLTPVDRFGTWLSMRSLRRATGGGPARRLGDFGCGYEARTTRQLLGSTTHAVVVDVALSPDLKADERITAIEGRLPASLAAVPDASLDLVLCLSVLEHLDEPDRMLTELRRVTAPGGICVVNVPSWIGKRFLEFSAFRLGLSPREEMDDHRTYYDPKDLWPMLVRAGFVPHNIACRRHKFGLNTLAVCRVDQPG
ncbi:MAG TPA: methyltransferase domain-containing protein [Acidimicrobiales bacterium]|nr:methyltransferase domain-containing protein [Acidimicrobiales bacterium]